METYLAISWSISRGTETYGYNICRLDDSQTGKRYRCLGGYDMMGTVVGQWLEDLFQPQLKQLDLSDAFAVKRALTRRMSDGQITASLRHSLKAAFRDVNSALSNVLLCQKLNMFLYAMRCWTSQTIFLLFLFWFKPVNKIQDYFLNQFLSRF